MSIFIETSVQIARLLSHSDEKQHIAQVIQQQDLAFVTSNYVYMEYQRTLISDFAHVYEAFRQSTSMGDAMTHIFSGQRRFRARSLVRCGQIMSLIYGNRQSVDMANATAILNLYLQSLLRRSFWRGVDLLPDPIGCDLVTAGINRHHDGRYTVADRCRKDQATCALPSFLEQNASRLQDLINYLDSHPNSIKDQTKVVQILNEAIVNPQSTLGQQNCWRIGDVIIALQVPDGDLIWSIDRDFVGLAKALNLQLFSPPSIAEDQG